MKLALANGHDSAPGMSVRITPKPGVASQLALAAAAISDAGVGATARPSLFTIRTKVSLPCLAYAYSAYPIAPLVWATALATPSLPLAPIPPRHSTVMSAPTLVRQSVLTLLR